MAIAGRGSKKIHPLNLAGFDLEFEVDLDASVLETRALGANASSDFVFAVGSIWFRSGGARYRVSGEFNSGNLIEWFKLAAGRLLSAPSLPTGMTTLVGSSICQWFLRYWDRIDSDMSDDDDEAAYNRLFPYCIIAENNACMVIFSAAGSTVVQGCAQEASVHRPICFEARVNGATTASLMRELRTSVERDVRFRSQRH